MKDRSSFAEVNLDIEPGRSRPAVELDPDAPFRILLMGDFSGKGQGDWRPIEIDRDNFDDVMAKVGPEFGGMRFGEIEDFGPDAIYTQKAFVALRESVGKKSAAAAAPAPERPPVRPGMSLLDSMLEDADPSPAHAARTQRRGGFEGVIDSIVAKYAVPPDDPEVGRRRSEADALAGACMRAVLHDPRFQALEAAWRSVFRLVRALETGEELRIYLVDIGKAELAAGLNDGRAARLFTDREQAWSLIAGNYSFGQSDADAAMLRQIAKAGVPFVAEADPGEGGAAWRELRSSPDAEYIGLAMPRVLLRLPYGKDTVSVESFAFEEMVDKPVHGEYLWGNPAFAVAQLIAESNLELPGLPVHVYDGEAKPCAEVLLGERDLDWIMEQGYMAIASIKGHDSARLIRLQSIAQPPGRLAGRWN